METQASTAAPTLSPSDVAAALIYFTNRRFLWSDPHRLHRAILVARDVCPLLRQHFGFSHTGVNPISRSFDDALGVLKLSRIVRMENTDYTRYIIDDKAREYVEAEILPTLDTTDREDLQKAAAIIREACGSIESDSPVMTP
jgi:hypothetical protein